MLSHLNVLGGRRKAAEADMAWNQWGPDDISLVAMPVGHIGGTGWGIVGLVNGAKGVVAREFDPTKVLDYIERDRISKMFMSFTDYFNKQTIQRLYSARLKMYSLKLFN